MIISPSPQTRTKFLFFGIWHFVWLFS